MKKHVERIVGNGIQTHWGVSHNLATRHVLVAVYNKAGQAVGLWPHNHGGSGMSYSAWDDDQLDVIFSPVLRVGKEMTIVVVG